ncbi:MAG: calcium-binding protein [Geminicoccaceae bacterium]
MPLFVQSYFSFFGRSPVVTGFVHGTNGEDILEGTVVVNGPIYSYFEDTNIYAQADDDRISGLSGDDWILPGPGDDNVDGGPDADFVIFDDSSGPISVDLAAFLAHEANGDRDIITDVENVAGSPEDDEILGDGEDNWLLGMDGDDVLHGRGGADNLTGEYGSDTLEGGSGDDMLDGEGLSVSWPPPPQSDKDTASYATASSRVVVSLLRQEQWQNTVGAGRDYLDSIDSLTGSAYGDTLTGDDLANVLEGGTGADTLDGKGGTDTASYAHATGSVTVDLATGTASGADGADRLRNIQNLLGGAYGDTLTGDLTANLLDAGGGNDILSGGFGSDTLDGGEGLDTASWLTTAAAVTVNLVTGRSSGGGGTDTLRSIEHVIGSDGHGDTLIGNGISNRLEGRGGDDFLDGGAGGDILDGGEGSDRASWASSTVAVTVDLVAGTASGSQGNDTLISIERVTGSGFADTLTGSAQDDTLDGSGGDDSVTGGGGDDTLQGGLGSDWVRYLSAPGAVTVDLAAGTATGAAGNDTLAGFEKVIGSFAHGDTISGNGQANILEGRGGDDVLRGRAGNDTLDGGSGIDRASYDDASGAVTVNLALGMTLAGPAGSDTLRSIEDVTGSAFDDTIVGSAVANRIEGGEGGDNINGREGDDVLDGGGGIDTVSYWDAPAFVYVDLSSGAADFGAGHDVLTRFESIAGSSFGDQLIGDAAVNEIHGSGGADTIVGLGGADMLTGGVGEDIFLYTAVLDADDGFAVLEEITDFVGGSDRIDLSAIDTDTNAAGDQGFVFIGSAPFTTGAQAQVRFANGIVYVDKDNDVGAEMAIALHGVTSMTAADFVL